MGWVTFRSPVLTYFPYFIMVGILWCHFHICECLSQSNNVWNNPFACKPGGHLSMSPCSCYFIVLKWKQYILRYLKFHNGDNIFHLLSRFCQKWEIVDNTLSGVARFFGARGEWSQWPPLTEILYFKKSQSFLEISFVRWQINSRFDNGQNFKTELSFTQWLQNLC
jgi:hypothetical protein